MGGPSCINQVYKRIMNKSSHITHLHCCHSKPASIAPGSAAAGLVGWGTGGAAVGILTNCSFMNSFNLQNRPSENSTKALKLKLRLPLHNCQFLTYSYVNAGSPDATVIRNWLLSAGSVSILTWVSSNQKHSQNSDLSQILKILTKMHYLHQKSCFSFFFPNPWEVFNLHLFPKYYEYVLQHNQFDKNVISRTTIFNWLSLPPSPLPVKKLIAGNFPTLPISRNSDSLRKLS